MELFKASRQWAERPADERFWDIPEMLEQCRAYALAARNAPVHYNQLKAEAVGQDLALVGRQGINATLTNYAMTQLCQRIKAPAGYLRNLPVELAAENINHGLSTRDSSDKAQMLLHVNGSYLARCFVSENYERIWNYEIAEHLLKLEGWRTAPARPAGIENERTRIATEADIIRGRQLGALDVKVGDIIAPAGLYASDRDMFAFLIDDEHTIKNPLNPDKPLARGFFVWNSEVGDKSFGLMTFLYDAVCGNHIVWGAQNVNEIRIRHVGTARYRAFSKLRIELRKYADSSVSDDELKLEKAASFKLGTTKEEVLENLFKYINKKKLALDKSVVEAAFDHAVDSSRYNQFTPLGINGALTEMSQKLTHASARVRRDQAAGKLLEIAF